MGYALPYAGIGVLWVIQRDIDNYFVSALLGPADFAIYSVGWIDVPLLSLILESVVSVLIIRVSALQREDRKADIRSVTAAASTRLAAVQLPLFAILFVAGHDLIVLLYTRAYEQSANIFLISILLLPLGTLRGAHRSRLQGIAHVSLVAAPRHLRVPLFCTRTRHPSFRDDRRHRYGGRRPNGRTLDHRLESCTRDGATLRASSVCRRLQGDRRTRWLRSSLT